MESNALNIISNMFESQKILIGRKNQLVDVDIKCLDDVDFKLDYSKNEIHIALNKLRDRLEDVIIKEYADFFTEIVEIVNEEMIVPEEMPIDEDYER